MRRGPKVSSTGGYRASEAGQWRARDKWQGINARHGAQSDGNAVRSGSDARLSAGVAQRLASAARLMLESTSLIFKNTKVVRMYDAKRNTLIYVAISKRVIEGSPMNALSAVPIMPWPGR